MQCLLPGALDQVGFRGPGHCGMEINFNKNKFVAKGPEDINIFTVSP